MAVSEQTPYIEYTANGTTAVFSLEFDCENQDHLIVLIDNVDLAIGTWSLINGAVVFSTAPEKDKKITIQRNTPVSRLTNFQSFNNSFRPDTINKDLDRIWLRLQEEDVAKFLLSQLINMNYEDMDEKGRNIRTELINKLTLQSDQFDQKIETEANRLDNTIENTANQLNDLIIQQGISQQQLQNYYLFLQGQMANLSSNKNWVASLVVDASGKTQQELNTLNKRNLSTTYDLEVITASDTRLLSDIYSTLEAAKVDFPFVTNLSPSLGWAVLQKQFKELDSTLSAKKIIAGTHYVNKPLTYNSKSSVEWDLNIVLDGGDISQYAITFDGIDVSKHSGKINLSCAVTDNYDNPNWSLRSWWNGILLKRVTASDQSSLFVNGHLKGQLVTVIGVVNNGNYAQLGSYNGTCGSLSGDWVANIISVNNLGSTNNTSQRSELTLDTQLPKAVEGHQVKIGGEYHYIQSVSGYVVTVEMWVNPVNTLLHVIYGGIAKSNGDNANGISFNLLRGFRSAATYSCATTMGVRVSTFGGEYNEIGLLTGAGYATNATLNYLEIGQWYSEFNAIDIFDTRSNTSQFEFVKINSEVGLGSANWPSNTFKAAAKDNAFLRNRLTEKPNVFLGEKWPHLLVGNNGFSESTRYIYIGETREHIFKNDTQVIQLDCVSKKIKNYGRNTVEIIQIGSALNGGVTQTTLQCFPPFTFRNPSEVSGRFYYLGRTSKPRELKIAVNDDNVIDIYEVNTDAPQLLIDLSLKTGTGVFRFNVASTINLGVNPPTSNGVMRVQLCSSDIYLYEAIEELYCYNGSGVLTDKKIRVKRGSTIGAWVSQQISQLPYIADVSVSASTEVLANKLNELLTALRASKTAAPS